MGERGKNDLQDLILDLILTTIYQLRDSGMIGDGGKIELQDLIPDLILTTIFINCLTLGG